MQSLCLKWPRILTETAWQETFWVYDRNKNFQEFRDSCKIQLNDRRNVVSSGNLFSGRSMTGTTMKDTKTILSAMLGFNPKTPFIDITSLKGDHYPNCSKEEVNVKKHVSRGQKFAVGNFGTWSTAWEFFGSKVSLNFSCSCKFNSRSFRLLSQNSKKIQLF